MEFTNKERIRKIYELLPNLNCGLCGFGNCGQFARAVAEGRASPFGCQQNPSSGLQINEILGKKAPNYNDRAQSVPRSSEEVSLATQNLKEDIRGLLQKTEGLLARINNLKARS